MGLAAGVVNENGSEVTEPALFVAITLNVHVLLGAIDVIHTGLYGVVGVGVLKESGWLAPPGLTTALFVV